MSDEIPKADARPVVYLVMPSRGPEVVRGSAAAYNRPGVMADIIQGEGNVGASWERNHNGAWYEALNLRDQGKCTHFAMIHADVVPAPGWLDILLTELTTGGYHMVSAVVPFRDFSGLTSTGIDNMADPWSPRRLTLKEIHKFPPTFTIADTDTPTSRLICNTGLWVADIRHPWCDGINFQFLHRKCTIPPNSIGTDGRPMIAGSRYFEMRSEDWEFSRYLAENKVPYAATLKVELSHVGNWAWSNMALIGQDTDDLYAAKMKADADTQRMIERFDAGVQAGLKMAREELGLTPQSVQIQPGWAKAQ